MPARVAEYLHQQIRSAVGDGGLLVEVGRAVDHREQLHDSLDQKNIFKEQGEVINKINKLISKDAFNVFIPN